eukprot:TRINITY_DN6519_c0_g1_i1.p1 TRINITY_DN6519_c0_g1~~TRINITY_DN6519_c0_g1_i1.p1  ORF type:complete len:1164 (+),score=295.17 TRINITY_DN6519_c0_g1_i1:31-3522(+)
MNLGLGDVRGVLRRSVMPNVLVVESQRVRELCDRTLGTSLAEYLTQRVQEDIGYAGETTVGDVRPFRFLSEAQLAGMAPQAQAEFVQEVMEPLARTYDGFALRGTKQVAAFKKSFPDPTWYNVFRWLYIHTLGCLPYESTFHPVACMLVASAHQELNVTATFRSMWSQTQAPQLFKEKPFLDTKIPVFYVLLRHQETPQESVDRVLTEARGVFGSKVVLLTLPSLATRRSVPSCDAQPPQRRRLFSLFAPLAPLNEIPAADKAEMLGFFRVLNLHVSQWLTEQITEHLQHIQTIRKSFASKVKSLFRREAPAPTCTVPVDVLIRRLGDLYVLSHEFENAVKTYSQTSRDHKAEEKTWPFFAATRELMGVCSFLSDGRDAEIHLQKAIKLYNKSNEPRLAVRATMVLGGIMRYRGHFAEAGEMFLSVAEHIVTDDEYFAAALFVEQAALCYLWQSTPCVRKCCMWMHMAGTRFALLGQARHAIRCFQLAETMYAGRGWNHIEDHLLLALVRHSLDLGDVAGGMTYARRLVAGNALPFCEQSSLLRQFLLIKQHQAKQGAAPEVELPLVRRRSVFVVRGDEDYSTSGSDLIGSSGCGTPPPLRLSATSAFGRNSWFRDFSTSTTKTDVCAVNEEITVRVHLVNPFGIPLQLEQLQLLVDEADGLSFDASKLDVLLAPSESVSVTLSVTPQTEGALSVVGLAFCLCNEVWCRYTLQQSDLLPADDGLRRSRVTATAIDDGCEAAHLRVRVAPAAARLRARLSPLPPRVCDGGARAVSLLVRNGSGSVTARNLRVVFSHPRAIVPLHRSWLFAEDVAAGDESGVVVVTAPVDPLKELELPFLLRPDASDLSSSNFVLSACVQYGSADDTAGREMCIERRAAVARARLSVERTLTVVPRLLPSSVAADTSVLLLKVANVHPRLSVRPLQLLCRVASCVITPLHSSFPSVLAPKAAANLFFRVMWADTDGTSRAAEATCDPSCVCINDSDRNEETGVRLLPQDGWQLALTWEGFSDDTAAPTEDASGFCAVALPQLLRRGAADDAHRLALSVSTDVDESKAYALRPESGCCEIPVTITVTGHSPSASASAALTVQAEQHGGDYVWGGCCRARCELRALQQTTHRVRASVLVRKPGVYDVGRLSLRLGGRRMSAVPVNCHHLITVEPAAV